MRTKLIAAVLLIGSTVTAGFGQTNVQTPVNKLKWIVYFRNETKANVSFVVISKTGTETVVSIKPGFEGLVECISQIRIQTENCHGLLPPITYDVEPGAHYKIRLSGNGLVLCR